MVEQIKKEKDNYYQCDACKLTYKNGNIAKRCEEWCTKHNCCNLDIIKYAVNL